jgi:hypothetical protein
MAGVVFASQRGRAKAKRIFREPFFLLKQYWFGILIRSILRHDLI